MSWLSKGTSSSPISSVFDPLHLIVKAPQPGAPHLPPAPTLTAPTLPQYPGFSPEEQAALQQQQQISGNLTNYAQAGPINQQYNDLNNQVAQAELQRYYNSLQNQYTPSVQLQQQQAKDWAKTKQQAAMRGIRLSGDSPSSAVSQSTAGNQLIRDFNQRYDQLIQNEQFAMQNQGQQANQQRLTGQQNLYNTQLGGYNQAFNTLGMLQQPYQQQRVGQFGVNTNQALANSDISNQNALNAYQASMGQTLTNYNNGLANYNANQAQTQSLLGLVGTGVGAYFGGPAGAAAGNQIGRQAGQQVAPQKNSYIQPYSYGNTGTQTA